VEFFFTRGLGEFPDGFGGAGDCLRLEPPCFVEAPSQPCLPAFFMHGCTSRPDTSATNNLIEFGADIMTARRTGSMSDKSYEAGLPETQPKNVTFGRRPERRFPNRHEGKSLSVTRRTGVRRSSAMPDATLLLAPRRIRFPA